MSEPIRPSSVPANPYSLFNLATVTYAPPDCAVVKMGSDACLLDTATGKALVFKSGWEEEVFGPTPVDDSTDESCPDCPLDKCVRYDPNDPRSCPWDRATGYVGDFKEGHPKRDVLAKVVPMRTREWGKEDARDE